MKIFYSILPILVFSTLTLRADSYTIKTTNDWTQASSYEENKVPSEGDTVVIQNGIVATLRKDDVGSIDLVCNKLAAITFLGDAPGGTLVIETNEGASMLIKGKVSGATGDTAVGKVIKQGVGDLQFLHSGSIGSTDFRVGEFSIEGGSVRYQMSVANERFYLPITMRMSEGTQLYLPEFAESCVNPQIIATEISGAGDVHGEKTTASLIVAGSGEFTGRFFAPNLQVRVEGDWQMLGSGIQVAGVTAANNGKATVKTIGMKSTWASSSVGLGDLMTDGTNGRFKYVGTVVDETDRQFLMSTNNPTQPSVFDAGDFGGLTFMGTWSLSGFAVDQSNWCVIDGSNTTACTLKCELPSWTVNGHDYTTYMEKRGSGVWCFDTGVKSKNRQWSGGLAVREGKVQFTSIAPAGCDSALGSAAILTSPYLTTYDETKKVDYAIVLGSADGSEAVLEYAPPTNVGGVGTERPIRLEGDAAIGTTGAPIAFAQITAVGEDEITLRSYGGDESITNRLYDIDEAKAKISLVKDGDGVLMIGGKLDISGPIEVNAGTLVVDNYVERQYRWFRFSVKQVYNASVAGLYMQELALYDAEGTRQNVDMEFVVPSGYRNDEGDETYTSYTAFAGDRFVLKPHSATYDNPGVFRNRYKAGYSVKARGHSDLRALFDDVASSSSANAMLSFSNRWGRAEQAITNSVPETWLRIVMRVAEDCPQITRYDYCRGDCKTEETRYHPVTFSMEGSADGMVWETLHSTTDKATKKAYCWMSNKREFKTGAKRLGEGYELSKQSRTLDSVPLSKVNSYKLGAGAKLLVEGEKLTISELRIDRAGDNAIKNVKFADNGVLDLISDGEVTSLGIKIAFDNVEGSDLKDWAVKVNGKVVSNLKAVRSNAGISVLSGGGFVVIR